MGRGRIARSALAITLAGLAFASPAEAVDPPPLPVAIPEIPPKAMEVDPDQTPEISAQGYHMIGAFVVRSRIKIIDERVTRIPIKPIEIEVLTNGVELKVVIEGREDETSVFDVYRSDGIGRVNRHTGVLEVVPGLQASCTRNGILRHVRVTHDSLTITEFAAVSDQTMVTHAVARPSPRAGPDASAAGS